MYNKLSKCFHQEEQKCNQVAFKYLQQAKSEGKQFKLNLRNDAQIERYVHQLLFFKKNKLISSADLKLNKLKELITHYLHLINQAKDY